MQRLVPSQQLVVREELVPSVELVVPVLVLLSTGSEVLEVLEELEEVYMQADW